MKRLFPSALFAALLIGAGGCKRSDSDKLAGVARTVSGNVQALLPSKTPIRLSAAADSLDHRVAERFRSDYYLADAPLQVEAEGTKVRLKGQVTDPAVKRRAVELAASTVGVESVDDEIVLAPR